MAAAGQASSPSVPSRSAPPESRWTKGMRYGFDKSIVVSDYISTYANAVSAKVGGERFWPSSNDMPIEIEKCERILRAFTVEGIPQKDEKVEQVRDGKGNWVTKKRKVLRKIPPAAIKKCKGVAIYSSMRSGIAPLGGGGGAGIVLVRLPDGSWSAPSAITPQSFSAGLLLGLDFLDVILLLNTDKAVESFMSHKVTLGAETGISAGPFGAGASAESGFERAPIFSYVRTRGAYAGIDIMGQAFLHRFDENERFYYWPGISAKDILTGKVRMPPLIAPVHRALIDAELGKAQGGKLESVLYDVVKMPESEVMKMLGPGKAASTKRFVAGSGSGASSAGTSTPQLQPEDEAGGEQEEILREDGEASPIGSFRGKQDAESEEDDIVRDGERLKLPPTPEELQLLEQAGIPDEEDLKYELEERKKVYLLPAPPMHAQVKRYWQMRPSKATLRPTKQLVMDGPHGEEVREAQFVKLPSSPRSSLELREEAERKALIEEEASAAHEADLMNSQEVGEEEEDKLLSGVSEKEADRVMQLALDGEDTQALKADGTIDSIAQPIGEVEKRDDESVSQAVGDLHLSAAEAAGRHADEGAVDQTTNHDAAEEILAVDAMTGKSAAEAAHQRIDGVAEDVKSGEVNAAKATAAEPLSDAVASSPASHHRALDPDSSSSPRPSLDENGMAKSPPSRPPRTRPPRRGA